MKLEQSFEVDAPLDEVWAALVDVERVAPCLPGAAVTGRNQDGSYNGSFTIKIGPTTASYTGKLEMQNVDEAAHSATMHAQGSDKRGQGGATATIASRLTSADAGTRVEVVTDYHITGRLARFGRGGMIEDISERLLREFAGRLQASLAGGGGGAAAASEQPTKETPTAGQAAAFAPAAAEPAAEAAAATTDGGEAEAPAPAKAEAPVAPAPTEAAAPAEPPAAAAPPPPPPPPAAAPPPPPPPPGAAAPPPPAQDAAPIQGLSLVGGVLLDRIKRNPAPVIGVVGGLLLLRLVLRRR